MQKSPIKLGSYGLIRVLGDAAAKFLQGQLTCDVRDATLSQSCLGAHCDPKGRVQILFRLFQWQENYYFFIEKEFIPLALQLLNKYAVFSKIKLEDVSEQYEFFGFLGQNNSELKNLFSQMPENNNSVIQDEKFLLSKIKMGFLLICDFEFGKNINELSEQENLWRLAEIEAEIPRIDLAAAGEFTPHDLNLPELGAVSFNKGCYTGQEIVARMQYLGKLKNHLRKICFSAQKTLPSGINIVTSENGVVGKIVCTALQEKNNYQGLAVLQDNVEGKDVFIKDENSAEMIMCRII